jgi:hypothetical protein
MTAFQRWISFVRMLPTLAVSLQSHGQLFLSLWFTFVFSLCLLSDSHAQSIRQGLQQPSPKAGAPQPTESPNDADPATKLAQARAELEWMTRPNANADLPAGIMQSDVIERRATLERLIGVYVRQIQNANQLARAERQREEVEKQAREWRTLRIPHPIRFRCRSTAQLLADGDAANSIQ